MIGLWLVGWALIGPITITDDDRHFVRQVLPVLKSKCLACHGDDTNDLRGDYDMRTRDSTLAGGESGEAVIIPGDAENSPLYRAVCWQDLEMPPKENDRLTVDQCNAIKRWINSGAPWPADEVIQAIEADAWDVAEGVSVKTSGGLSDQWSQRRYNPADLWAYQPIPPASSWGEQHPASVDHFINDQLSAADIPPGPLADRETLIRRATYDLTGLPPTIDQVQAFVDDERDDNTAFAAIVDRLLGSPHYGEHWGRHWLDVVRYADSSGFANDYERGNAWRYRDYVVRSFNDDKPFDQFVREQIAGDELEPANPEMNVAVGFLRMGPWELTGMEVAKVARQRFLDDVTNAVGETFLAHSLQCAKCHDHKFDPVPTRDYYSIQACFATTQLAERETPFLPAENLEGFQQLRYLETLRDEHDRTLVELNALQLQAAEEWFSETGVDPSQWKVAVEQTTAKAQRGGQAANTFGAARNALQRQGIPEDEIPPKGVGFSPLEFGRERVARKGIERLRWEMDRYEGFALSVYNGGTPKRNSVYAPVRVPDKPLEDGELEQTAILVGGDPFSAGPLVSPGTLSVLNAHLEVGIPNAPEGRRTALANWITDVRNPLTARVIVNRVWMWHFGKPIAGNPNNFGATGKKPTHPELLDWLSRQLIEDGWLLKSLHRHIMMSHAYRRATFAEDVAAEEVEMARQSYALFTPRRLTAEELRDSMLAASGELNPKLGGIPNRPEINIEVAMQPRMVMGTFARAWVPDPLPSQRHRRSLYALSLRGMPDPAMEVFNQPGPDFSCEGRDVSLVTPQVFAMFNSLASYDRAVALALRAEKGGDANDRESVVNHLYEHLFARKPDEAELALCVDHWQQMEKRHAELTFDKREVPLSVQREAVEENTGERFTFAESLPGYADFVPDPGLADVSPRQRGLAEVALVLLNSHEFSYVY